MCGSCVNVAEPERRGPEKGGPSDALRQGSNGDAAKESSYAESKSSFEV